MASDRTEYLRAVEAQMHELDDEIRTLEIKADEARGDEADDYRRKIADLERRKAEIDERFRKLAGVSDDEWPAERDRFDASWNRITAAFRIHR